MADENVFTFDTSSFEKGIKRISSEMMELPKTANKIANGMGNAFGKTVKNVKGLSGNTENIKKKMTTLKGSSQNMAKAFIGGLKGMAIGAGIVALAFKGIQGILNNMPEIGKTFGIAKDIFMKNLLWPLRKFILPYLQKLLDWVRTHRLMFVKWGQVIVNVFRVVIDQVKFVINLGKRLVTAFKGFFENTFGVTITNITELLNLLTFKFAVVMVFLQSLVEKLIKTFNSFVKKLSEVFGLIVNEISKFTKGFAKGFGEIDKKYGIIKEISAVFQELSFILKELSQTSLKGITMLFKGIVMLIKEVTPLLEPFGEILGQVFGVALLGSLRSVHTLLLSISGLIKEIKGEEFDWKQVQKAYLGIPEKISIKDGIITGNRIQRTFPSQTIVTKRVKDAIVKDDGTVIETDPKDNLIATKNKIMLNPSLEKESEKKIISVAGIKIDFSGMQIILQSGTREDASNTGETIVQTIRERLQDELTAVGEY
jgi:hypothetical protein